MVMAVCLWSGAALAQGARYDTVAQTTAVVAGVTVSTPLPGAAITVCNYPATGQTATTACTNTATLYTDQTLAVTASNPMAADTQGNFGFWVRAGGYDYSVCTTIPVSCSGPYHVFLPIGSNGTASTVKCIGTSCYAGQFNGSDCGAKAMAVDSYLASSPGEIWIDQSCGLTISSNITPSANHILRWVQGGTWTLSASITANFPTNGILGPGENNLIFNCTLALGDCFRLQMSPFSTTRAGRYGGFTVACSGCGASVALFHVGDIVGSVIDDLMLKNSTGGSNVCLLMDNQLGWTERNTWRIDIDNCTTQGKFQFGGSGTNSFGYNNFDFRLNIQANQTGILGSSGSVYHSHWKMLINALASSSTVLNLQSGNTSLWSQNFISWRAECSGCTGATLLNVAANSTLDFVGIIDGYNFVNSIAGTVRANMSYATGVPQVISGNGGSGASIGSAAPASSPGAWLLTNPGAPGSFLFGTSGNLTWDTAGTWKLYSDGAHNGGWAILGSSGNSGLACLYEFPDSGTPTLTQAIANASLSSYQIACWSISAAGNGKMQLIGTTPLSLLSAAGGNAFNFSVPAAGAARTISVADPGANANWPFTLTTITASLGGGSLSAGACATNTTSVTGAATTNGCTANYNTYPGDGFTFDCTVTSAGTVSTRVCNRTAGALTPTASTYQIHVITP